MDRQTLLIVALAALFVAGIVVGGVGLVFVRLEATKWDEGRTAGHGGTGGVSRRHLGASRRRVPRGLHSRTWPIYLLKPLSPLARNNWPAPRSRRAPTSSSSVPPIIRRGMCNRLKSSRGLRIRAPRL